MTISWDTASDEREKYRDGPFVTRYGTVDGARRFQIRHAPQANLHEDRWCATDDLAPEGQPNAMFEGTYAECVDFCWRCNR